MKKFTQKTVQLLAVICMVVLTTFSAKADQVVISDSDLPTTYPTAAVYEIGGVNFCLNDVANFGNGVQIKKTSGYIYNTTELADIASITFTEKDGKSYAVTVYEGTEENPSTNVVTGIDGVYTFSSGMNYFSIVNGSSASYVDAITITYSEEATTSIIAPSQLAIGSISCGSTTTSTLAIKGTLLTSDVTVSLAGDDAFAAETATYSAEEVMAGVDFAITFTAPETAGDYTATVTISSSECETIEVAVSATAVEPIAIADIFSMDDDETAIIATATVDYVYTYGAYISDAAGTSILALYLTEVEAGDVLSDISATVGTHNGVKQIKSVTYESSVAGESTIEAIEVTLADLMSADLNTYGCQLVTVKGVTLATTGFESNKITITQDSISSILYNGFYITNDEFPTYADVTGYITAYSNAAQINPRWQDDVVAATDDDTETDPEASVAQTESASIAVAGGKGTIVVKATANTTAIVYNVAGAQVATMSLTIGNNTVELEQGIYLVVVDGAVAKAVVR